MNLNMIDDLVRLLGLQRLGRRRTTDNGDFVLKFVLVLMLICDVNVVVSTQDMCALEAMSWN